MVPLIDGHRRRVRRRGHRRLRAVLMQTADNLAREYQISREECDEYAAASHQRAAKAWAEGKFADDLVPVAVPHPLAYLLVEGLWAAGLGGELLLDPVA